MMSKIRDLIEKFSSIRVLVVGDVMLDRYWWGSVDRISPEAPVPVVRMQGETVIAGGAANVAGNIRGLGAQACLVGVRGPDSEGETMSGLLAATGISAENLVCSTGRPTTVKTRVVAHQQQIVRVDQETKAPISPEDEERVWGKISLLLGEVDIVVISDYAKGLLTDDLLTRLITTGKERGLSILVDPKGNDYQKYARATILTPNKKEALEAAGGTDVVVAGQKLVAELDLSAVLVTRGEEGMTIFEAGEPEVDLPALARHVYDVTGAGDTVIATLAVALAAGADLRTAAEIANLAAGFVVEEVGTTIITAEKLKSAGGERLK